MDVSKFSLKGKVALVIGGAGDIGKAIAETYSVAGADVVISSRKQENLDKAAAEIKAKSKGKVLGIAGHLGKLDTIKALVDAVMKECGRIDIVVNSSGSSFMVPLTDVEEWHMGQRHERQPQGTFLPVQADCPHYERAGRGQHY